MRISDGKFTTEKYNAPHNRADVVRGRLASACEDASRVGWGQSSFMDYAQDSVVGGRAGVQFAW